MKKKITLVMVVALLLVFCTGVFARDIFEVIRAEIRTDFKVEIDGKERVFKNAAGERVYPILHDGTTYLPLRAIAEIMDKTVYWYEDEKRIEIKDEEMPASTVTDADVIIADEQKTEKTDKKEDKQPEGDYIGKEKAKEIALKKAGFTESDVKFVEVELDYEKGVPVYEVEFKKGGKEYKAELGAESGTILKWNVEVDD